MFYEANESLTKNRAINMLYFSRFMCTKENRVHRIFTKKNDKKISEKETKV